MRRGSIFIPLLLIALGALFLIHNLYRELPLLDYLAKYWPFLLIVWGVLRIAEILFWSATNQPLPVSGISGGEWVFIIFLCFFGTTLNAALGFSNWFPRSRFELGGIDIFGESFVYPISGEKPAGKNPRIVLESFRGNARIMGGGDSTVKVTGHKTVRSMDQNNADRANEVTPFEIEGGGDRIVIRTNQDRVSRGQRVSDDMEISVPKGSSIEAHGRSGDFDITNIDGSVTVDADRAAVRLENIGGETRLEVRGSDVIRALNVKGNFDLRGNGSDLDLENMDGTVTIDGGYTGNVAFQNLSKPLHFTGPQTEVSFQKLTGQIRMPLGTFNASNLVGPARLETRSRDIQISDFTNTLEISVDRGDVELRPSLPVSKIDAHTRAGNIVLALPPEASFDLTATTNRGDVNAADFGGVIRQEQNRRGGEMHGSNGGPPIELHSDMGQITVRKANPNEPPFAPRKIQDFRTKGLKQFKAPKELRRLDQ
ncbi:MAG: DUF4097 family beta strand repeat protein [Bryobacterales bacterium]|nr:DUF4097 family beta strand repeat protein [Bryobacterales bacterium]MBV9399137.1 DUF4097 family beta strand repeat protein [Bryobacterales bacterium]